MSKGSYFYLLYFLFLCLFHCFLTLCFNMITVVYCMKLKYCIFNLFIPLYGQWKLRLYLLFCFSYLSQRAVFCGMNELSANPWRHGWPPTHICDVTTPTFKSIFQLILPLVSYNTDAGDVALFIFCEIFCYIKKFSANLYLLIYILLWNFIIL